MGLPHLRVEFSDTCDDTLLPLDSRYSEARRSITGEIYQCSTLYSQFRSAVSIAKKCFQNTECPKRTTTGSDWFSRKRLASAIRSCTPHNQITVLSQTGRSNPKPPKHILHPLPSCQRAYHQQCYYRGQKVYLDTFTVYWHNSKKTPLHQFSMSRVCGQPRWIRIHQIVQGSCRSIDDFLKNIHFTTFGTSSKPCRGLFQLNLCSPPNIPTCIYPKVDFLL